MKQVPRKLIVALYPHPSSAKEALRALAKRGCSRASVIDRTSSESTRIHNNGLSARSRLLAALLAALLFALLIHSAGYSTQLAVFSGLIFALVMRGALLRRLSGLTPQFIGRYERYVFPGETMLLAEVASTEVRNTLGVLRESVLPAIFVIRPQTASAFEVSPEGIGALLTTRHVRTFSEELAARHRELPVGTSRQHVLERLTEAEDDLEALSVDLVGSASPEQSMSPSAEWLYDNMHLIRVEIAEIRRNLPRRYDRELPAFKGDNRPVSMRIAILAEEFVRGVDSRLNAENITELLDAYQTGNPLTISELWAFPISWRFAIIEELRRLSLVVSMTQRNRDLAQFWADRLRHAARRSPETVDSVLVAMGRDEEEITPALVARLFEQLHEEESALVAAQQWFERRLESSLAEIIRDEHNQQARTTISIRNGIGSLRQLGHVDFKDIFERVSLVERILREDPAGSYPATAFETRDRCRQQVERLSRFSAESETDVARLAIGMAAAGEGDPRTRHVGYYLLDEGLSNLERATRVRRPLGDRFRRLIVEYNTFVYLTAIVSVAAALVAIGVGLMFLQGARSPALLAILAAISLLPASELAIQIINSLVVAILPPRVLQRMSFEHGIPENCTTLVVVPMMLLTRDSIRTEVAKLEVRYLANPDEHIYFSLLSDFTDAVEPVMAEDDELLATAIQGIEELNNRYGERFLLFHRERRWSMVEERWIGWERKRGKLEELNGFLAGAGVQYEHFLRVGRLPANIRFVITLDSDTQLPAGAARKMIESSAHPLNRVELSPDGRTRLRGFTIMQPRVSITLPGTTASRFTQLFTNTTGTDPYCQAVSDVYQDLFGQGIFHGKAIYDVVAFHRLMWKRFPEERLLSHDLIEGAHVGVGFISDVELFESFPYDYYSHSKRQHRWVRGDWQIADWILPWVPVPGDRRTRNPLSVINRWKVLDNLRRSLVPVASMVLLLSAWLAGAAPFMWTVFVAICLTFPAIMDAVDRRIKKLQRKPRSAVIPGNGWTRIAVTFALLPHQAWLAVDAIVRVWYRRLVSHRHLLEWETAQSTGNSSHRFFGQVFAQMRIVQISSFALAVVLTIRGVVEATVPFVALWITSPELLRWIHRPKKKPGRSGLDVEDRILLRELARRTWRYFDDLVGPEHNWLPPDNSQEALKVEVAPRTSPTNIGLWLTSAVAAYDFGYLTPDQLAARCASTLTTMEKLEHHEGHLLNWYDTRTLQPLLPRYISAVDSGNLVASLWILEAGLREAVSTPLLSSSTLRGLADTLNVVRQTVGSDSHTNMSIQTLSSLFGRRAPSVGVAERIRLAAVPSHQLTESLRWRLSEDDERAYWLTRLDQQIWGWTTVIDRYLRWMELLAAPPREFVAVLGEDAIRMRRRALRQSPSIRALATDSIGPVRALLNLRSKAERAGLGAQKLWLDELAEELDRAQANAASFLATMEDLIGRTVQFAEAIDLRQLYDADRRLFVIGRRVGEPMDTTSHYDLLASECRLTSLIAIARGEVPVSHWLALGRPFVDIDGKQILLSWHGTMFEYLMPNLFNHVYEYSLLDNASRMAVECQTEYAEQQGIPWGISESAFAALDANQTYQYKGNGVPQLGLKRGLEDDHIVSPYSSMLALQVDAWGATRNLRRLIEIGMLGKYGLYEAIDYTRMGSRQGSAGVIIYCFMSHHQGMSMMAMDNTLHRNAMQKRFHGNPKIKAVESLLYEGVPAEPSYLSRPDVEVESVRIVVDTHAVTQRVFSESTPVPRAHIMGNGRYFLMITNSGGSLSRWGDVDLTRWRADTTRDHWGTFFYIRDQRSGKVWSAGYHPASVGQGRVTASFGIDRAEFFCKNQGIDCLTEVTVCPEDDVEVRRMTLTNRSLRTRALEITGFAEICLAPHGSDRMHPAFGKLFVQTEILPEFEAILAGRRPRSPGEALPWMGMVSIGPESEWPVECETDRAFFIGRGRSAANPQALDKAFESRSGAVLDPAFIQRRRVELEPAQRVQVHWILAAGPTREHVVALVEKYRSVQACDHAFELAWTHAQLELRYLGIRSETAHHFQELGSHLLYPNFRVRAQRDRLRRNVLTQSRLWAHGISGDLPILAVYVADSRGIPLVRQSLLCHTYWRLRGLQVDLVIINQEAQSYDQPLHEQLMKLVLAHSLHTGTNVPGGVFILNWGQIPAEEMTLVLASASAVLGPSGSLLEQLSRITDPPTTPRPVAPRVGAPINEPSPPLPFLELPYFNGLGGFSKDGRVYSIYLSPGATTPLPWINVIATPDFGTIATESGLGMTWYGNSQNNRLTPWHNDPISDTVTEAIYLRDEDSGAFWTPTALPVREEEAYRANHGAGYTLFEHNSHGIEQTLLVFVPFRRDGSEPVRIQRLRLKNTTVRQRRISVTPYSEWTLGGDRETTQLFVVSDWDATSGALIAQNTHNPDYGSRIAFASMSPKAFSYTADRTAFLGRNGLPARPAAMEQQRFITRTGPALDPCAALQIVVELGPGEETEVIHLLGQAATLDEVRSIVARYSARETVEHAFVEMCERWDTILGAIQVQTPALSVDLLLNRWMTCQTLSCRMWGRSALYQSGGAFGFRDQLQDCAALLYAVPSVARDHILLAASRQFVEGDVQHWWQPASGQGIRSRCTDDLLWLPYVVAQYVRVTGDNAVLEEQVPFIEGPLLKHGENDSFFVPSSSLDAASLFEHCRRAIEKGLTLGPHGLPLIGRGDWNDGMNLVGHEGRGESVWLAFFLLEVLKGFIEICDQRGEVSLSERYRYEIRRISEAIEASAWDGEWYLRAFFDNGAPLGSHTSEEARIDSLPQSWSVISTGGDFQRSRTAMKSVQKHLVRPADRLILLFDPPFQHSADHPGYIQGYPPGVRENGGQYTHAALWVTQATALLGDGAAAVRLLQMINPVERTRSAEEVERYQGEPYVIAADIYGLPGRTGRCGWTWYTGSAGWFYRVWIEEVFGFKLRGETVLLEPRIPPDWPGFTLTYRYKSARYEIAVRNEARSEDSLEVDGRNVQGRSFTLVDDGNSHSVLLRLGTAPRERKYGEQKKDQSVPSR